MQRWIRVRLLPCVRAEEGGIAIEYTLIAAIVSLSIITFLEGYAENLVEFLLAAASAMNSV